MFSEAATTGLAADVGLTIQQTYTNYFSALFNQTYPPEYTAKPNS